jgi:hypothetical protein
MGFLIDTNVLSELRKKKRANPGVQNWFAGIVGDKLYLSVLVIGEVRNGIERLRRRDPVAAANLEQWLAQVEVFAAII